MAVLQLRLRSGFYLIGFSHAAADLGAGAGKSRNPSGLTPPRKLRFETCHHGGILHGADAVPPRTQELVGAVLLQHQHGLHGDEGLFPERCVHNIGDGGDGDAGGEDRGSRRGALAAPRSLGLWGGDTGGGKDRGSRRDDARAAPRSLRLWGGDAGGGEDLLGGRLHADEACAAYRTLRLRSGADGDDLGTGMHQQHGWSLRGGDPDGDLVAFRFLHDAELAPGLAPPRNKYDDLARDVIGAALLQHQGSDAAGVHKLSPELGRGRDGDAGEDPARRSEHGYTGVEFGRRARLPIAACLQHGDGLRGSIISCLLHSDDDTSSDFSWKHVLGYPLAQTVPSTCSLVAATVCLETQHRLEFEKRFGAGTFPCRAASPRKLRSACFRQRYWKSSTKGKEYVRIWGPHKGGNTQQVIEMIMRLGGVRTTNAPPPAPFLLPLQDWYFHYSRDSVLTPHKIVQLIFEHGPCIGSLFATAQFFQNRGSNIAYCGCRHEDRERMEEEENAGMHAVVCYAYRHRKKKGEEGFDILVLDNQRPIGTSKWVEFEEFDIFYMLIVHSLTPRHLLDRDPPPLYPISICTG